MWKRSRKGTQFPTEQQVLSELEQQQLEIAKIQKQRDSILKLHESFLKKDQQLARLTALVDKYKPYFEYCSTIRIELAEKEGSIKALTRENQLLRREFEQLLKESSELSQQLKAMEMEKQVFLRERHTIERVNREIQDTFKEYQSTCRRRQQELLKELEDARRQVQALQIAIQEIKNNPQQPTAIQECQNLQIQMTQKEKQLQKAKILNQELTEEFDKSVNKICEFQRQLNKYRMENHELRKTLGLVLEQDKYQKLQEKYLKNSGSSPVNAQDQQEQDSDVLQSSPDLSDLKL